MKKVSTPKHSNTKRVHLFMGVVVFVMLFMSIPPIRDPVLGIFMKKQQNFYVFNNKTKEVVAGVSITINGKQFKADDVGKLTAVLPTGSYSVKITHENYSSVTQHVYISPFRRAESISSTLEPLGELATITIKNKLNGNPLTGIRIQTASGSYGVTGVSGAVTVVLPKGTQQSKVTITGDKIVSTEAVVRPAQDAITNIAYVIPNMRIPALTTNNEVTEVVTSYVDGSSKQSVVTAKKTAEDKLFIRPQTGSEAVAYIKLETDMFSKLYSIDGTGKYSSITQVQADYRPIGWLGEDFLFIAKNTSSVGSFADYEQLFAYSLKTKTSRLLYETKHEGDSINDYVSESFGSTYILGKRLYITTDWRGSYYYGSRFANKRMRLLFVDQSAETASILREWQAGYYARLKSKQLAPSILTLQVELDGVKKSYWEIAKGKVEELATVTDSAFMTSEDISMFIAPNDVSALWQTKAGVFLGGSDGKNSTLFANAGSFTVLGWVTNDYVLLQQGRNMYIASREGIRSISPPVLFSGGS